MGVGDWIRTSANAFRDESPGVAARHAAREFSLGAARRIVQYGDFGSPIWEFDWDVLCVLDGCRVDALKAAAADGGFTAGDVDAVWSAGSQSAEWMSRNFAPRYADEMARTAYVTANPWTAQDVDDRAFVPNGVLPLDGDEFGLLSECWRDCWDESVVPTVPPRPVTDRGVQAWRRREEFGVDRVVLHYMQPHVPFRSRPEWFDGYQWLDETVRNPWLRLRDGELDAGAFRAAYRDNLTWVLEEIDLLRRTCDASLAVTADHGNAFGEWGVWGHPVAVPVPALRRVPWVELRARETTSYRPSVELDPDATPVDGDGVDERLAALGYLDAEN